MKPEDIVKKLALEGIRIDADDPVIIVNRILEISLHDQTKKIEESTQRLHSAALLAFAEYLENTKKAAENLITGSAQYIADQVRRMIHDAYQQEHDALDHSIIPALDKNMRLTRIALAVSVVAFGISLLDLIFRAL